GPCSGSVHAEVRCPSAIPAVCRVSVCISVLQRGPPTITLFLHATFAFHHPRIWQHRRPVPRANAHTPCARRHTHTHDHTHAHTHTHTHTHTPMLTCIYTQMHAQTKAHAHSAGMCV